MDYWKNLTPEILNGEEWAPVVGYEGAYEVSSLGRVKSLSRSKVVKTRYESVKFFNVQLDEIVLRQGVYKQTGYLYVGLNRNGASTKSVHSLVAISFLGSRQKGMVVNHKNGIKTDNRLSNLEYCSPRENHLHGMRIGIINQSGPQNGFAKLTADQVRDIRKRENDSLGEIAARYSISKSTAWNVRTGKCYTCVL